MNYENVLCKKINKSTHTVKLMDEFEEIDLIGNIKYETLLLEDVLKILDTDGSRKHLYYVSVFIQRLKTQNDYIPCSLTFTDFKRYILGHGYSIEKHTDFLIVSELVKDVKNIVLPKNVNDTVDYIFEKPIQFNAQNSGNRSGYGNEYKYGELVYEGTLYGEVSKYVFVGARYKRIV